MRVFSAQDDGTAVSLRPGDSLQILLAENPTTGYRWHLGDWDRSILDLTLDEFHPPATTSPGAGGEHLWVFVARAPGHGVLQLAYRRRWASDAPAKTFALDVSVI